MEKRCITCGLSKPRSEFPRQAATRDGLMRYCRACNNARVAAWKAANPDKVRASYEAGRARATLRERARRLGKYGLTPEQYEAMLAEQEGRCAGCRRPFSATPYIDHCHASGRVRGLLCNGCNKALGFAEDDPDRLRALARYVEAKR